MLRTHQTVDSFDYQALQHQSFNSEGTMVAGSTYSMMRVTMTDTAVLHCRINVKIVSWLVTQS